MKNLLKPLLMCSLLVLSTSPAIAGPGHEHSHGGHGHAHGPVSKTSVIHKAQNRLEKLIKKGKLDKSWHSIKAASAEKKTFNGQEEWLVTFNNPALSGQSKKTLYMFFKLDGHYLATNYTGK